MLDCYGVLTLHRQPKPDDLKEFRELKESLELNPTTFNEAIERKVKRVVLVTMSTILKAATVSDALKSCNFLKSVGLILEFLTTFII